MGEGERLHCDLTPLQSYDDGVTTLVDLLEYPPERILRHDADELHLSGHGPWHAQHLEPLGGRQSRFEDPGDLESVTLTVVIGDTDRELVTLGR